MSTYWVAFTDQDGASLGVCVVEESERATDVTIALRAIDIGCAPGRGAMTVKRIRDEDVPPQMRGRLLSPDEVEKFIAGKTD